jgi:hypothetical protein
MNALAGFLLSVVLVDALVVGPLTAWLADERGRDPAPWFFLGALFGPIALLSVGFGPRKVGATFKACVECQEPIFTEATTCPFCRTDLIAAESAERRRPGSPTPEGD